MYSDTDAIGAGVRTADRPGPQQVEEGASSSLSIAFGAFAPAAGGDRPRSANIYGARARDIFENMALSENILSKLHDLLAYLIPILNRFPRHQKFLLGDRIGSGLGVAWPILVFFAAVASLDVQAVVSVADGPDFTLDTRPYFGPFATGASSDSGLFTVNTVEPQEFVRFARVTVNGPQIRFSLEMEGFAPASLILESAADLNTPIEWQREENAQFVAGAGGAIEVQAPLRGAARFYRIRLQ